MLIYVGISAGAHLATPDLLPRVSDDNRWKARDLATTTEAMGLVSFSVLAHYGKPDRGTGTGVSWPGRSRARSCR